MADQLWLMTRIQEEAEAKLQIYHCVQLNAALLSSA